MKTSRLKIVIFAFLIFHLMLALALQSTAPAFMWSPYLDKRMTNDVNYQTISPKVMARSVLSEGGWSSLLCDGKRSHQLLDLAFVFIGKELQSLDIAGNSFTEKELVDLIKVSFMRSNFSMAFPYVATEKQEPLERLLVSEFSDACENGLGVNNVQLVGSCSMKDKGYENSIDLDSLHDYLQTRKERESSARPDVIIYCDKGLDALTVGQPHSESNAFSAVISSLDNSGARYAVLYASDPYENSQYPSKLQIQRFLDEASPGNGSANSTICDGVCQIKTSLLEGILVGIVLLIILISGLCCMMGIDTPTRFEIPQDST